MSDQGDKQQKMHKDAGTHPGTGWKWHVNTPRNGQKRGQLTGPLGGQTITVVETAFDSCGQKRDDWVSIWKYSKEHNL